MSSHILDEGEVQPQCSCYKIVKEEGSKTGLRGFSPQANYTDRASAACRAKLVSNFENRWCRVVSTTDPQGR
jgi:hypothetical protein